MKKEKYFLIIFVLISFTAFCQKSAGRLPISITYSQNGVYSIKSISYDKEFPTLRGKSIVYKNGKEIYQIQRAFDLYKTENYRLAISNNGETVVYLVDDIFYEGKEFNNVTIYRKGNLVKTYNLSEFTGCNPDKEKCEFFYDNYFKVVDRKKSKYGTKDYKKVFKENTSKEEIFLNENFVALNNDTLYSTDSRKIVTVFDLNKVEVLKHIPFQDIYPKIKNFNHPKSKIIYIEPAYKYINDFVDTKTKKKLSETISDFSNLKFVPLHDKEFHKYKLFKIELTGYLNQNGKFEIETIDCDKKPNVNKIKNYIKSTTFKSDFLPDEIDKQYFKYFFGGYRNYNDSIAKLRTQQAKQNRLKEFKRRMTLDSINGIYIPKNLKESIITLNSKLNYESRQKIKNAENIFMFNSHISSLGIWIRNNWGINGGSRLLKYFSDRGINDREEISGIIISKYQEWLNGKTEVWKEWEKNNPIKE